MSVKKAAIDLLGSTIIIFLLAGVMFMFAWSIGQLNKYFHKLGNDDKRSHFINGATLTCSSNVFDQRSFLVSKESGWKIYKDTFKKEDMLIQIADCKEEQK